MKKIAVIGLGQAGTNIANSWNKIKNSRYEIGVINTSNNDNEIADTISSDNKYLILNGDVGGMAKERERIIEVVEEDRPNIMKFLRNFLKRTEATNLILISSTGGGTGSGLITLLSEMMQTMVSIRCIFITPGDEVCITSCINTRNVLSEIQQYRVSYRAVSNGRYSKDEVKNQKIKDINNFIIESETKVIDSAFKRSEIENIDSSEMEKLLFNPGYSPIYKIIVDKSNITEKAIDKTKTSLDFPVRDKVVDRLGFIYYTTSESAKSFNEKIVQETIGTPIMTSRSFLSPANGQAGEIYIVASGCMMPSEIEEYKKIQEEMEAKIKPMQYFDLRSEKKEIGREVFKLNSDFDKKEKNINQIIKKKTRNWDDLV